jgi:hypothetical protein
VTTERTETTDTTGPDVSGPQSDDRRCQAMTAAGERCRQASSVNESGFCTFHDPERVEEAMDARRRGGQGTRGRRKDEEPPALDVPELEATLEGVVRFQAWVATAVARGAMEPKVGSSLTYALLNLRGALEKRDMERIVEDLRTQLREATGGGPRRVA